MSVGASYDPGVLAGPDLVRRSPPTCTTRRATVAKAVLGTANYMTAAICRLTGNQPASACTPTVQGAAGEDSSGAMPGR